MGVFKETALHDSIVLHVCCGETLYAESPNQVRMCLFFYPLESNTMVLFAVLAFCIRQMTV